MDRKAVNLPSRWRLAVIAVVILAGFTTLATRLHEVQIEDSGDYADRAERQCVRRVLLPATRGRIFDRNGVCLADNRPNYCLAFYIEELRRPGPWSRTIDAVDAQIDELSAIIGRPREVDRDDIAAHVRRSLPMPFIAWRGLDSDALARFAEHIETPLPGVDIFVQSDRIYPRGQFAAHLLGYVGRDKPVVTNFVHHYYLPDMCGRAGIEASCDAVLAGRPGGKNLRVDAAGYMHDVFETLDPVRGRDVTLTIDSRLQEHGERLLSGTASGRGAMVAIDPRNGEVLALVSVPGFNPNDMTPAPSTALWRALNRDKDIPLLNRAVCGAYPPGSTFKPCVAAAALESGVSAGLAYDCTGCYALGRMRLHCWHTVGHGEIDMRKAIEQSCNPYFCNLGVTVGWPVVHDMAASLGFGERTGIILAGESRGLLPDDAWKRRAQKDGWRSGDTANCSIGQGAMLATPIQLATYAAALANGGTIRPPRLVLSPLDAIDNPLPVRRLGWKASTLAVVRGGMHDVIEARTGPGWRARVPGIAVAGKTGTAEFGSRANRRKHTWMIAFAPFDDPVIALAVLVEDGDSGGKTVAPIVSALLSDYFGVEPEEAPAHDNSPSPALARNRITPSDTCYLLSVICYLEGGLS